MGAKRFCLLAAVFAFVACIMGTPVESSAARKKSKSVKVKSTTHVVAKTRTCTKPVRTYVRGKVFFDKRGRKIITPGRYVTRLVSYPCTKVVRIH